MWKLCTLGGPRVVIASSCFVLNKQSGKKKTVRFWFTGVKINLGRYYANKVKNTALNIVGIRWLKNRTKKMFTCNCRSTIITDKILVIDMWVQECQGKIVTTKFLLFCQ